jgi:DNA-binding response OmpR family regulator
MGGMEILLVEDNAGDAVLIRQVLADASLAVTLHIARDGEQALVMTDSENFQPTLIILDLNIPRIPGHALLERWRANHIPVVVFSSSQIASERERVLALGAREFIEKPTDIAAFCGALLGIVQRWGTDSQGTARGG